MLHGVVDVDNGSEVFPTAHIDQDGPGVLAREVAHHFEVPHGGEFVHCVALLLGPLADFYRFGFIVFDEVDEFLILEVSLEAKRVQLGDLFIETFDFFGVLLQLFVDQIYFSLLDSGARQKVSKVLIAPKGQLYFGFQSVDTLVLSDNEVNVQHLFHECGPYGLLLIKRPFQMRLSDFLNAFVFEGVDFVLEDLNCYLFVKFLFEGKFMFQQLLQQKVA